MSDRGHLPYVDIRTLKGLFTKGSEEAVEDISLKVAKNIDFFNSYGALGKTPGSTNVLVSAYTESAIAMPISWIGFYKAADLNGQILRHTIVAAGTKLHRITGTPPAATLTALTGTGFPVTENRTSGIFASHARFDDFLLISNRDPYLIGKGDTLVKYDGANIQKWGVLAPGETETIIEGFLSAGTFTVSGGSASNESITTKDGASVKFSKTSTTQANGDLTKSYSAFSVSTAIPNRGKVSLYIPRGQIENFDQTAAVQIFIGSDGTLTTDFYTFTYGIGELVEGWNDIVINFNAPTTTTGTPVATALNIARFRVNSDAVTDIITDVRWDKFLTLDTGALTAANGTGATISTETVFSHGSVYKYRVTYVSKYGHEANSSPDSVALTITSTVGTLGRKTIDITNLPISADPQVTARKIYRTAAGGVISLFVARVENNETTTHTDSTGDLSLGQESPPIAGDLNDDNSPPPLGGIVKAWKRTVFIAGDPAAPNTIYFSEDSEPESFPLLNTVTFDDRVTGIYETYSGLVIETETGKWQAIGEGPDFAFNKIINKIGCVGRRAFGEIKVSGWAVDRDGIRLYDLNNPVKISEQIRDKFDSEFSQANMEFIFTVHSRRSNCLLLFAQDTQGDYTSIYVYQYPTDDILQGQWWQLDLPDSYNPQCTEEVEDLDGDTHLYVGDENGMIYELLDPGVKSWQLVGGSTEPIITTFTTKYFRLGDHGEEAEGVTGRTAPRFIEIRHAGDATTWNVLIETAAGPNQTTATSSATVSVIFATGEDARRYPVPGTLQPGEYVRLTLTNSDSGVRSSITGMRLYYHVQPGQYPKETGQSG